MIVQKIANSKNDEFYTPWYVVLLLLKYLKPHSTIWCPFDTEHSWFVRVLKIAGHKVAATHISTGTDFFTCEVPKCDYIISNPPYSCKGEVFQRLFEIGKPFSMLVGVVGLLESQSRFDMFRNNKFEIMYLNKRISYFKDYNDQRPSINPPFSSVFVCSGMLQNQIEFAELPKVKQGVPSEEELEEVVELYKYYIDINGIEFEQIDNVIELPVRINKRRCFPLSQRNRKLFNDNEGIRLNQGDCLELIKSIPTESIDLVVTDPPYPVISGGKPTGKGKPSGILSKNDGKIFEHNNIDPEKWIPEIYRVLKQDTHCYIMTNTLNLEKYMSICREVGFELHNVLMWEKNNATPNRWYMKNGEFTLFLRKGKAKTINNPGSKMIHSFDNILGNKLHPTEKPVGLMQMYIENSSKEGDIVLDPFVGAGSTTIACINSNRKFIGFEIDKKYYGIANRRVEGHLRVNKEVA